MGEDIEFFYAIMSCIFILYSFLFCVQKYHNRRNIIRQLNNIEEINQNNRINININRNNINQNNRININQNNINQSKLKIIKLKSSENCSICFEDIILEENLYQIPCRHNFHIKCINEWIEKKDTCPLCRSNLFENI